MVSFKELSISPPILRAIEELGFEKTSPIQAEALPLLLGDATDFLGLAATGTGKTAAFSIPLLERIDPSKKAVQALILCPTRELALQVAGQIDLLGKHKGIKALPIYGGSSYYDQIRGLREGAPIVVGTPGRMIDHLENGRLQLDNISTVVLDEADEMISMGFKEDLEKILESVPRESSNIWLFSATMSREVRKVADEYLRSPKQVQINRSEVLPTTIEQLFYMTKEGNKPEVLCKLIDHADDFYGLIFCQTKTLVVDLTQYLNERGYKADCLHGDKSQDARERTMRAFREKKLSVLVCTDVAARGIDVKDVTHVINYSLPRELDNYVHRIGRTGRSGKTGIAMSLVTPSHRGLVMRIERMTKSRMAEGRIPTRKEVGKKKFAQILDKLKEQESYTRAMELMDDSWSESLSAMTPQEIAARFMAMLAPDLFAKEERPAMVRQEPKAREPRGESRPSAGERRPRAAAMARPTPRDLAPPRPARRRHDEGQADHRPTPLASAGPNRRERREKLFGGSQADSRGPAKKKDSASRSFDSRPERGAERRRNKSSQPVSRKKAFGDRASNMAFRGDSL